MRRLRWEVGGRSVPKRPYRDSAVFYGVLAGVVVVVGAVTGGSIVRAGVVALAFFVVATGFAWWRWRERLGSQEDR